MKTLTILLALFAFPAAAAELQISFEWPTTLVDGSPQPTSGPGKLTSARFEFGTCAPSGELDEFGTKEGEVTVPYPETEKRITVTPGIKCVRGYTLNDIGQESDASNLGRYFPKPGAINLRTVTRTAYELRKMNDGDLRFVQVGTVVRGAKCGRELADGYAIVDSARLTRATRGNVIAAKCQ